MDEQRLRISEDLRGLLRGDVAVDPLSLAMYASDASLYQIKPTAVVWPLDTDDVVALAGYSTETGLPLVPRGAGSGVAGGCLGGGIIVDFSRHMRRLLSIDNETVRVEPGIVRDELNRALRPTGRYFPPDPAGSPVTTIGGMLGVDAAGSRAVRIGSTRDHVERIELVLADGRRVEAVNLPTSLGRHDSANGLGKLVDSLTRLLDQNAELIREHQPPLVRNASGYFLRGILADDRLQLPRMLVGSEGTLGLFTAATLHTALLPEYRGIVLLLFGSLDGALDAVEAVTPLAPSACDLMDRRVLSLAREADPRFTAMIPAAAEAALIVEQTGYSNPQARDRIRHVIAAARNADPSAVAAHESYTYDDVEFLWSLPKRVVRRLTKLTGSTRPLPFVEDIAVPPEALREFLPRAQRVFQKFEVTASLYSHAAAGQVHLRPFLPPPSPTTDRQLEDIARELYQVVFSLGGTISGEHGDGLARTAFIRSQYGPLYRVFQQVKQLFDPENRLNPGKIISDDPHATIRHLRPPVVVVPELVELELTWSPEELASAAFDCNGCGGCRTQSPEMRMCPFFRVAPDEDASPRAKANVFRAIASGTLARDELLTDEMRRLADLCFNCKQCQLECPAEVNIPQMMIEAKAAGVAANGLGRADWILARGHSFGALGSLIPQAANWLMRQPAGRWMLERLVGIHRHRKLPRFSRRPFLRSAARRLTRPPVHGGDPPAVVYFVDHFANFHDSELAQATVAILEHNNIPVHVPPDQAASGMAMVSAGDLEAARRLARRNLRALVELAREGHPILCSEPAAAICLKQEYPMLLDHPDVELLAGQVVEAGGFLAALHRDGKLRTDFEPVEVTAGYHTPCHVKALSKGPVIEEVLSLIPGLRLSRIEEGCSGMAGAYGLTRQNFDTSLDIGRRLIERMQTGELDIGTTECSSCRIQMEQGTTTPTLHPLKLLALAYGLMPELRGRLRPGSPALVLS